MSDPFIQKLCGFVDLSADDIALVIAARSPVHTYAARHDLASEGDVPGPLLVMLEGWACRYTLLADGHRQITAFLLPGDFGDLHGSLLHAMDHGIATLTTARVATIARPSLDALFDQRPALLRAFWWAQLVDEAVLRAWIVSMGRRNSVERVAHLMCELYARLHAIGLAEGDRCELPLTQAVIGDALGLTPVHVNRVLRTLRLAGVMELKGGALVIAQVRALAEIAGFDDNYLHRRLKRAA